MEYLYLILAFIAGLVFAAWRLKGLCADPVMGSHTLGMIKQVIMKGGGSGDDGD